MIRPLRLHLLSLTLITVQQLCCYFQIPGSDEEILGGVNGIMPSVSQSVSNSCHAASKRKEAPPIVNRYDLSIMAAVFLAFTGGRR